MASRTLTVVAKVKDAASAPLKKVEQSFKETSKAVKGTGANLTEFNRIMFSTAAFVGLFTKAMGNLSNSLNQAGELERLSEQYSRVVGPRGELFKAINGLTKNTIDRMEAMRAGIALQTTGVTKDVNQIANIVARAGTAAKRAGLNSAEGIKKVVDFMKDGSVSSLSFLNVLTPTNAALQAQMAVLQRAGGIFGGVISTQARLRLGMAALRAATQGMEEDKRDLLDTLQSVGQSFTFLKGEIGSFLGAAFTPLLDKLVDTVDTVSGFIERLRTMDKTMLQTVKNIIITTGSFASLLAVLGTARLAMKALGALGIGGIPFLAFSLLGLANAFGNAEKSMEPFVNFLKKTGAVLVGSFQLVSSFLGDANNFKKGIGMMDAELAAFLEKHGLLELTKNIARVSSTIIAFVRDAGNKLVEWIKNLGDLLKPIADKFSDFFGQSSPEGWSRKWIESSGSVRDTLVKVTAAALGLFGAFKVLGMGKGVLQNIPFIGKLFGGKSGRGPDGTSRDPIHVVLAKKFGVMANLGIDKLAEVVKGRSSPAPSIDVSQLNLGLVSLLAPLGKFAAALAIAAGAVYAVNRAFNWLDEMLGKKITQSMDTAIDSSAGLLNIPGSSKMREKTEKELDSPEAKFITSQLRKFGHAFTVDSIIGQTRQMQAEIRQLSIKKQAELNMRNPAEASVSRYGEIVVTPEASASAREDIFKNFVLRKGLEATGDNQIRLAKMHETPEAFVAETFSTLDKQGIPKAATAKYSGQEAIMESLTNLMEGLNDRAKKATQAAIDAAISDKSAGSAQITKEELINIYRIAMDTSKVAENTAKTANKSEKTEAFKTQRC